MPRLRYLKNYEWEDNDDNDSTRTEQYSQGAYQEIICDREQESGSSWLSNAQVISSFSESKLHEAISRYKVIIRLLEAELLARTFVNSRHPNEYSSKASNVYRKTESIKRVSSKRISNYTRSREGNSTIHKVYEMRRMLRQLSLSKDQKRILFEEWIKIQKEGEKE